MPVSRELVPRDGSPRGPAGGPGGEVGSRARSGSCVVQGRWAVTLGALVAVGLLGGCAMAGLGSGLELNVTDLQTRQLTIRVEVPAGARILETRTGGEVELGTGSATIERYVLQRATFGRDLATGLFLCESQCTRPLETFLVASSADQLFAPSGELRLQFRIETANGSEELSRIVTPGMLEDLWSDPELQVGLR